MGKTKKRNAGIGNAIRNAQNKQKHEKKVYSEVTF